MNRARIGRVCLALPATELAHSFGEDHDVYKVGGKMFAIVGGEGAISFKVSDIAWEVLTEAGHAAPAPYMARAKWVQVEDPASWGEADLADHLKTAHALIAAKLTRKARAKLGLDQTR
jgi:predicted DNA-binding protein (MmcQ/YjbR family)